MAIAAARLDALPPDLYPFILQRLHLRELTRLYQVSRSWQERADDAEAWILLLPEFDPLHIIGRQGLDNLHQQLGATINLFARAVEVRGGAMLKNLTIFTSHNRAIVDAHRRDVCDGEECEECDYHVFAQGADTISPALVITNDDPGFDFRPYLVYGLIAEGLRVTSTVGSAVLIDENASAAFHQCSMHSYVEGCNVTMCLGVMAKANATLTMNGCTLSRCRWGVFAGTDGERLRAGDNFFHGNELEDIALDLYAEAGILVQPWASPDAGLRRALT